MLVGMSDPGLQVMPTHRLLKGVGNLTQPELTSKLAPFFDVESVGQGEAAGVETWKKNHRLWRADSLGFCTVSDGKWTLATLRDKGFMKEAAADKSETYRSLGVSILHRLVLEKALAPSEIQCQYVHLTREVFDAVTNKDCQLACLVQPATVDHIRQLSGTFETMPAESTSYPKLASGILFNPIHSG